MPKRYPAEFRRRALDLITAGRSVAQVALDLEISSAALLTDNHFSYKHPAAMAAAIATLGAKHIFIKAHCPWQNGKVERLNITLQTEWAYRQVFRTNDERTAALAPWLDYYNNRRRHPALGGLAPISRLSPTS